MLDTFRGILIPFLGTVLGAACVLFLQKNLNRTVQRILTGFAAGVMTAASVWSLLIPALEQAQDSLSSGCRRISSGNFLPAAVRPHDSPSAHEQQRGRGHPYEALQERHADSGGNAAQHSGGHGGGRGIRRISLWQRPDHCCRRTGAFPRHRHPEFSGGCHHFHAPACCRHEALQGVCLWCSLRHCRADRCHAHRFCIRFLCPHHAVSAQLCSGRNDLCGSGRADSGDVRGSALQHRHHRLCHGLRGNDDAGHSARIIFRACVHRKYMRIFEQIFLQTRQKFAAILSYGKNF